MEKRNKTRATIEKKTKEKNKKKQMNRKSKYGKERQNMETIYQVKESKQNEAMSKWKTKKKNERRLTSVKWIM